MSRSAYGCCLCRSGGGSPCRIGQVKKTADALSGKATGSLKTSRLKLWPLTLTVGIIVAYIVCELCTKRIFVHFLKRFRERRDREQLQLAVVTDPPVEL